MLGNEEFGAALVLIVLFTIFAVGALRQCRFTSKILNSAIVIGVLAIAVFFGAVILTKKGDKPWSTLWTKPAPDLPGPTFRESLKEVICYIGPLTVSPEQISENGYGCMRFETYQPFTLKKKGNRLLIDAVIYGLDGKTNAEVKENEVNIRPEIGWDRNWSDTALEVVDEAGNPVLQIIYQTPSRVRINGIFLTGNGQYCLLTNSVIVRARIGEVVSTEPEYRIPRLFKYPGWRHRGEYQ